MCDRKGAIEALQEGLKKVPENRELQELFSKSAKITRFFTDFWKYEVLQQSQFTFPLPSPFQKQKTLFNQDFYTNNLNMTPK